MISSHIFARSFRTKRVTMLIVMLSLAMRNRLTSTSNNRSGSVANNVNDCYEKKKCPDPPTEITVPSDDESYTSMTSHSSSPIGGFLRKSPYSSSSSRRTLSSPWGKRMTINLDDDDDDKKRSPMARRSVLRRLSGSQTVAVTSKLRYCKGILLTVLSCSLIFLFSMESGTRKTSVDSSSSSSSYLRASDVKAKWPQPQVVVLPGPHLTATTSLQMCMVKWTTDPAQPLLDSWMWAAPESSSFKKHNLLSQGAVKNFSPLYGLLSGQRAFVFQQSHPALSQHAMKIYKEPMLNAWKSGKRIIYGSEEMDFATSNLDSVDPDKVMDGVFDILPWKEETRPLTKQDIEAVILHKGSRIDHLLEIWREVELDGGSFRKFLSERSDILSTADSLGLAKVFLERDVRVSIVDTSGVENLRQTNVCHVVSCQVLGVPCSGSVVDTVKSSGSDISRGNHDFLPSPPGDIGLSQEDMEKIDRIMNEYDCGLRASLETYSNSVRIVYQHDLFSKCSDDASPERPFSWVVNEINKIVSPAGEDDKDTTAAGDGPHQVTLQLPAPQVVMFPGPHGSSSSNLQSCFYTWANKDNAAIGDWTWAAPDPQDLSSVNLKDLRAHKVFAPYFAMLSGQKSFYLDRTKDVDQQKAIDVYKKPILEAWESGKQLVFGSEEMDWAVSMIETMDTSKVVDGIFDILPFKEQGSRQLNLDDIVAVIPYDADRVGHLRSIWQGAARASGSSFRTFLSQNGNLFSTSNALGLVKAYLDRGIRTVVVDMSGIAQLDVSETNECHVVACEVMGERCNAEKLQLENVTGTTLFDARISSHGSDPGDLDLNQEAMEHIEAVMKEYDCGLRDDLLEHENSGRLQVLHRWQLFQDCPVVSPKRGFSWLIRQIKEISSTKGESESK